MNSKFLKLALCLGLFACAMNNDGWSSSKENNQNNKYYNYEKYNTLNDDIINYDEQKKKAHFEMKKSVGADKYYKYHDLLSQMTTTKVSADSMFDTCKKIQEELSQQEPNDKALQRLYRMGYEQFNKANELYQTILANSKIVKEVQKKNTETRISIENQIKALNEELSALNSKKNAIQDIEEEHKNFMEKNEYRGMFGKYRMSRQDLKNSLDKLKEYLSEQQQSNNDFVNDMRNNPRYNPKQDISMIQDPDEQFKFNNNSKTKNIYNRKNNDNNEINNIMEEDNNVLNYGINTIEIPKTDKDTESKPQQNQIKSTDMQEKNVDIEEEEDEDEKDNDTGKEKRKF